MKVYVDIVLTDIENANEITPKVDHKAVLYKDVIKKPKISLWNLYKLKKLLETGYEKLYEDNQETKLRDNSGSIGSELDKEGGDDRGDIEEVESELGTN